MNASETEYRQFIEDMGDLMDDHGLPHMAGRVIGALLICPENRMSHDELVDDLQASKGAISMSTRLLLHLGIVDRISIPGHRKHYYRIHENLWDSMFLDRSDHIKQHCDVVLRALDLVRDEPIERKLQLIEMQAFFDFLLEELPGIVDRWAARRNELFKTQGAEHSVGERTRT